MNLSKCFLIVFNTIFFLLGGACLGVGLWIYIDKKSILELTSMVDNLDNESIIGLLEGAIIGLIAGGGFVFVIGFCGCVGALKEVKCLLYLYALIVGAILAGEITAGILGYVYQDKVEAELKTFLQRTIDEKYNGVFDYSNGRITTVEIYSLAWEFVHWQFSCCGINGSENFLTATNWNRTVVIPGTGYTTNLTAPFTCCAVNSKTTLPTNVDVFKNLTQCVMNISDTTVSNANKGCYDAVKDEISRYAYVVMGVGIGIAVAESLGIIAACCLIKAINKEKDEKK